MDMYDVVEQIENKIESYKKLIPNYKDQEIAVNRLGAKIDALTFCKNRIEEMLEIQQLQSLLKTHANDFAKEDYCMECDALARPSCDHH